MEKVLLRHEKKKSLTLYISGLFQSLAEPREGIYKQKQETYLALSFLYSICNAFS